jgi:hypothetical protein
MFFIQLRGLLLKAKFVFKKSRASNELSPVLL